MGRIFTWRSYLFKLNGSYYGSYYKFLFANLSWVLRSVFKVQSNILLHDWCFFSKMLNAKVILLKFLVKLYYLTLLYTLCWTLWVVECLIRGREHGWRFLNFTVGHVFFGSFRCYFFISHSKSKIVYKEEDLTKILDLDAKWICMWWSPFL